MAKKLKKTGKAKFASNGKAKKVHVNGKTKKLSSNGKTSTRNFLLTKGNLQKIVPNLWFKDQAEEAAKFYTSIFRNSQMGTVAYYGKAGAKVSGMPEGSVMAVTFRIEGQEFVALNGGPIFKFSEAISFIINCETQKEIDNFWEKLTEGGEESVCGWLKDKFGLSWQVVPSGFDKLMQDKDPEKIERVMEAFLKMKKIDIATLKAAEKGQAVLS
jgi:predicted 3-demethylubiquinone-9 3-methyltransferase (glyoxalase superfamily)